MPSAYYSCLAGDEGCATSVSTLECQASGKEDVNNLSMLSRESRGSSVKLYYFYFSKHQKPYGTLHAKYSPTSIEYRVCESLTRCSTVNRQGYELLTKINAELTANRMQASGPVSSTRLTSRTTGDK